MRRRLSCPSIACGLWALAWLSLGTGGCLSSANPWTPLTLVCADELATRTQATSFGESGARDQVTACASRAAATLSDGATYSFSSSDGDAGGARGAARLSLRHTAQIWKRGPLAAANLHESRGVYRFVVPADVDGGATDVRLAVADVVENAGVALALATSARLRVYDAEGALAAELPVGPGQPPTLVALAAGEYRLLAEATTSYRDLAIPPGSDASPPLRRTLSFEASVREADLPRALRSFEAQDCAGARCPDVLGAWVVNLWAFLADNPSMRSDRGPNLKRVWDSNSYADDPHDFVNLSLAPASAYTFRLPVAQPLWSPRVDVPQEAGAVFCRRSVAPWPACTSGADCGPIHAVQYPETIVIRKVPEERYYTATVQSTAGCSAAGPKQLALGDAWPVATDADDEIQPFMPDGGHPGPFGTRFILQQLLEARQEAWFEPVSNRVPNGRMEDDCRTRGWTASAGTLLRATYTPLAWDGAAASGGGAVVGASCRWVGQTAGATLTSEPIEVTPGAVTFVRWFQRALGTSKALGMRILHDADGDGRWESDVCGSGAGGACAVPASLRRLDHPDLPALARSDPDGAGALPPAFYANDDARADARWCADWCWLLLRVQMPQGVRRVRVQFVAEGPMVAGVDELVAFPALGGAPDGSGTTWLMPPGEPHVVATGDSRCAAGFSDWTVELPFVERGLRRTDFHPLLTAACRGGQDTRLDLTKAVGCTDGGCGGSGETYDGQPDPAVPGSGLHPKKVYPHWTVTFLGENDAKAASLTGGQIESFVAGALDEDQVTQLGAALASDATSFPVTSTRGFPLRGGRLLIGDEMVKYFTSTPGAFGSGVRGLARSRATSHPAGTTVRNLSLQGLVRRNGSRHVFLASHPWRGLTDGSDAKCSADPAAQDCSEWLNLATRALIERAH